MATVRYGASGSSRTDATREAVLAAAEELVREGAFHASTVDELADRAGVSRATVFARFGSRLGILEALNVRCSGGAERQAIDEAAATEDPVERIEGIVEASSRFWESWGDIQRHIRAVVTLEPEVRPLIEAQRVDQARTLLAAAELADDAGLLRPDLDARTAGRILHMITSLEAFTELRRDDGLDLERTIVELQHLARSLLRSP